MKVCAHGPPPPLHSHSAHALTRAHLLALRDTKTDLEDGTEIFALVDHAREGLLGRGAFHRLLEDIRSAEGEPPPTDEEVDSGFASADVNGDAVVDFNECLRYLTLFVSVPLPELKRHMGA